MLEVTLAFPPSTNHYWRFVGRRVLISREGRAYRQAVCTRLKMLRIRPLVGPLDVRIDLYPPDRRRRDCDNAQKCLVDSLQHGGAYIDDSQIKHLDTWLHEPVPGGKAVVQIRQFQSERGGDSVAREAPQL